MRLTHFICVKNTIEAAVKISSATVGIPFARNCPVKGDTAEDTGI